jgi:HSP20 family protein
MDQKSLVPSERGQSLARRPEDTNPLLSFRRDVIRLFDDFLGGFGFPTLSGFAPMTAATFTPKIDVSETDDELRIVAELPGIDPDEMEITLNDDVLTIRGEKETEEEEEDRDYHLVERTRGVFARMLRLPFPPDPGKVKAMFKDGLLTIVLPKPKEVKDKVRKIEVTKEDGAGGKPSRVDRAAAGDKPSAAGEKPSSGGEQPSSDQKGPAKAAQ